MKIIIKKNKPFIFLWLHKQSINLNGPLTVIITEFSTKGSPGSCVFDLFYTFVSIHYSGIIADITNLPFPFNLTYESSKLHHHYD